MVGEAARVVRPGLARPWEAASCNRCNCMLQAERALAEPAKQKLEPAIPTAGT